MKKRPGWIFSPESMENKLLWGTTAIQGTKPIIQLWKILVSSLQHREGGGQKEEEKRRKKMIAEKKHKRKPSVKIAPETLQNCNGFLLLKLIGVAML